MAQNNLFMDDDDMRLYIDVQPLFIDELENSKNSAAASALRAAQSEEAAKGWKNDIEDYKTGLELFYARATDGITNSYNTSISGLSAAKNSAISDLTLQKNSIQTNLNNSLNSAIVSIRTNGQSYVNQAQYYAEEAQRTVDNRVSTDHLNQSKGLLTGFVSTDEEVFADVQKYAHSTFDLSKFTVVGSPTITGDGIASGFSSSNYLTIPAEILNSVGQNSWKIQIEGAYNSGATAFAPLFSGTGHIYNDTNSFMNIGRLNTNKYWFANLTLDNAGIKTYTTLGYDEISDNYDGQRYKYILSYDKTSKTYTSKLYFNDVPVHDKSLVSDYYLAQQTNDLIIGYNYGNYQIDLKQFSITVDGVEVFSGNKTGIDTIKPDDYTVVGSPTITEDGVASGFSGSNKITKTISPITNNNNIIIKGRMLNTAYSSGDRTFVNFDGWNANFGQANNNGIYFSWATKSSSVIVPNSVNEYIDFEFEYTANTKLVFRAKKSLDETYISTQEYDVSGQTFSYSTFVIGAFLNGSNPLTTGSIDLNSFKIYVDGNLVYQPCLKIPYTESKTGSKVVDAIYRDRVADMASQFGFANYYTLDEDNGNFTLPKGELYGMIEKLRELIIQRTS